VHGYFYRCNPLAGAVARVPETNRLWVIRAIRARFDAGNGNFTQQCKKNFVARFPPLSVRVTMA